MKYTISKQTSRAAPARIRRRLKLQILEPGPKAPVGPARSPAACSVAGAGTREIGASADVRAATVESTGFLTAIENVPRLLVNRPPAYKSRIMVPIRSNKRDCFLIRPKPPVALAAVKNSAAGSSPAQWFVLYQD